MTNTFAALRRLIALCYTMALGTGSLAAQNATPRYSAGWWDAASIAGSGLVAGVALFAHPPAAACAPCDRADLIGLDRGVLGLNSSLGRASSHVLLVGVAGGAVLASVTGMEPGRARGNAVVLAQALSWTSAVTEVLKVGVHRARPVLYKSGAAAAAADPDNRKSFPSGHASVAFAAATAYATLAAREHLPHARRNAILLYLGAVGVSYARVAGGKHFPTDVAAGAALGAGIGFAVGRLHPVIR